MDTVRVVKLNEAFIRIDTDSAILLEMAEHFSFMAPNSRFDPRVRNKQWDGRIRLLNLMTRQLYYGLLPDVIEFCEKRKYHIEIPDEFAPEFTFRETAASDFAKEIQVPDKYEERDYQSRAFVEAINNERGIFLSSTGSGKSFIIYMLTRFYMKMKKKVLIIVPTTTLIQQFVTNFEDFNNGQPLDIHLIYSGQDKNTDSQVVISTWQSIYKLDKKWFNQFGCAIGDEAHTFQAKSLISIMTKLEKCKYRFGFTGTLEDNSESKVHEMVLKGLFGPISQVSSTSDLIERGYLSKLKINCVIFDHDEAIKRECRALKNKNKFTYKDEINWVISLEKRNQYIRKLVRSIEGNSLILFNFVEKHGIPLYELIKQDEKSTFIVYKDINLEERERIRQFVGNNENCNIVASFKTFQQAIDIPNLTNLVFASPAKGKIRVLQSIGRVLRPTPNSEYANVYDLSDDLSIGSYVNAGQRHLRNRVKYYMQESAFELKYFKIKI